MNPKKNDALIPCPHCGQHFRSGDTFCPHCQEILDDSKSTPMSRTRVNASVGREMYGPPPYVADYTGNHSWIKYIVWIIFALLISLLVWYLLR